MNFNKMVFNKLSKINFQLLILALGFLLAVAHLLGNVAFEVDAIFFAFFVIILGIPHGALDHIVAEKYATSHHKSFSLILFLGNYLLQMVAYALLWFWFPAFSLFLFLIISAWHFGESDMHPAPKHIYWLLSQAILGAVVLFFILMREPDFTAEIVARITRNDDTTAKVWQFLFRNALWVYASGFVALSVTALLAQQVAPVHINSSKFTCFVLLLIVISFLPLLPAFALYFGGWHSINTFNHISSFVNKERSMPQLWLVAMPFSIVAFVFLLATAAIWYYAFSNVDPLPILFIFIAIITLPHLLVMHNMFRSANLPG